MEGNTLINTYKFSFSYTETITGNADEASEEKIVEGLIKTFGHAPDFKVNSVEYVSEAETQLPLEGI